MFQILTGIKGKLFHGLYGIRKADLLQPSIGKRPRTYGLQRITPFHFFQIDRTSKSIIADMCYAITHNYFCDFTHAICPGSILSAFIIFLCIFFHPDAVIILHGSVASNMQNAIIQRPAYHLYRILHKGYRCACNIFLVSVDFRPHQRKRKCNRKNDCCCIPDIFQPESLFYPFNIKSV